MWELDKVNQKYLFTFVTLEWQNMQMIILYSIKIKHVYYFSHSNALSTCIAG